MRKETQEREEMPRLSREVTALREERDIVRRAGLARPKDQLAPVDGTGQLDAFRSAEAFVPRPKPVKSGLYTMAPRIIDHGGGLGPSAFVDGLVRCLGAIVIGSNDARAVLASGRHLLCHGAADLSAFTEWASAFPGLVHVLWHSGWAGSELMHQGEALFRALLLNSQQPGALCWLDTRDVPPNGAHVLAPVWEPDSMAALGTGVEHRRGHVGVGLCGYPSPAKNLLASVVGVIAAEPEHIHLSSHVFEDMNRGPVLQELLRDVPHTVHPMLPRREFCRLVAGCEILVHPSLFDTWPYSTLEAAHMGTAVVGSEAIAWMRSMPRSLREQCQVMGATETGRIAALVRALLRNGVGASVAAEQDRHLRLLAPQMVSRCGSALRSIGFHVEV